MVSFALNEQQQVIFDTAMDFARQEMMPHAASYDESMDFPWPVIEKAHEAGLLNLSVPEALGGPGLSHLEIGLVSEALSYGCSGMATAMTASDLALTPLVVAGRPDQIQELAAPLLEKPRLAAYCVTEPGAGSDVGSIRTTCRKDGESYILNGEKMWITNASVANWYYVLATLDPQLGHKAMCAFAIPGDLAGIKPGKKEKNLGQRCSDTRAIVFDQVKVPAKYRLGEEGEGFKIAMKAFDKSRPNVAAVAVGIAQCAMDHAIRYAKERKTFGKPIHQHQAVNDMIADMAKDIEAARLLYWKAACELDEGRRNTSFAAMAKCFAGDVAVRVTQDAVQVFGGYGYNSEYPVEKLYRDAKICQIYEGTQQIQRMIIGRTLFS